MGYGPRESSSSSWRSLLDSCLGATRAAGDEIRASLEPGQQAPFVTDKDRLSSPVATGSDLHAFTYAELRAATGGFPSRNIIGEGGFGAVYRGSLEDGVRPGLVAQAVAVKRGLANDYVEELLKEAMFVAQLQHRHPSLVKMIGYCYHGNQRLLVYEFMGHGSLDNYLSKPIRSVLPWSTRLSIVLATAKGLASVHGEEKPLVCSQFNASNILLDSNNDVKISLSDLRLNTRSLDGTEDTTRVGRSMRGCAPEYIMLGHLTVKSVVYSFGVVMLEILITGKTSFDLTRPAKKRHSVDYARPCLKDPRRLARIMDRALKGVYPVAATQKVALLAYKCLRANPKRRPDMSAVLEALDHVTAIADVEETPMIL
ncbi:serine/threonine-protein kinase RIPK [Lolium perenne]|uniref:serine/threonine-protein kinase RIPK n=1 Tax=Lolium perenne TaxID=4522 RepID=UPI0021EAD8EF|nr:serine/threonine-protein kinase RIPK-like isoform X1 [Lolium perenne]